MSNLQELHNEIETFEAGATVASAALLSRFSELKKRCQENKIPIFALLKPHCRRVVITAFTSFSNAAAAVKRLGGPPWNASIDDLIGAFGEETLLSESFLRALDDLSQTEPPPSWHQTRHAITRASLERKASTENTRIPRLRLFTPKDVVAAKSFLHPGVTVCHKRKKRRTLASRKRVRLSPVLDNDSCDDSSKDEELTLTFEQNYGDLEGDVLDTVQDGGFVGDSVSGFISDDFESTSSESESDMENGLFIDYAQAASDSADEGTQEEDVEDEVDGLSTPEPVAAAFGANDSLSPPRSPKTPPPSQLLAHGFPFSSPVMELAIRSSGGRSAGRKYSAGLSNAALTFDDDPPDSPTASIRAAASRLSGIRQDINAPHSSLDQVLNQLRDGGCVGHAAIWTLLELLARSPELRVIDVAYPTGSSWADWASLRRQHKPHPGVKHILVPLYVPHARHWVLLHFDLASAHVTAFDSLLESRTSSRSDYFEAATAIVRYLGLDWDGGAWGFEVDQHAPLQQDDDADGCGGIFVVVTSVCIAAKEAIPRKINARIWRLIFRLFFMRTFVALWSTLDAKRQFWMI
ncbi:uncharacterized protein LTHEOB_11352 [Lasiodiplodia theobromae]|uniref:uncharacterized protein n=1 Tax=Lasiodiplodia theobromae TaxID=45133 RepID=UPI0015C35CEB|nr:uncharacterized protein LTHEOB_11352 [Lasiodiplodia theobromae]KAF4537868.1 hypothetical protein LTHEOB_11352 [Lasiodiplodia theobromae]